MEVRLKVLVGPNAGRDLPVVGPKFLVGRAEDCQLRPRSDVISRHHCVLLIEEATLLVRDFGSKNGTLVNGERVRGECELKNGDKLNIGPLEFEVCLRSGIASQKRPKVESIKEAAARTAESSTSSGSLDDVGDWINGETKDASEPAKSSNTETRQFKLTETDEIDLSTTDTQVTTTTPSPVTTPHSQTSKTKAAPGKLPPMPSSKTSDSGQAASDVLNKFFKRR